MKFTKTSKNLGGSEDGSPEGKTKTHLEISDTDLKKLEIQVKAQIRRGSHRF